MTVRRRSTLFRIACAVALGVARAEAAPPAECGTTAVSIEAVERLQAQGEPEAALRAASRMHLIDLPLACRVYVRALETQLLFALDRLPEVRATYAHILDEVPWWRPPSRDSNPALHRIFEAVRAEWVRTNAGPLRVTPNDVSLLSPAVDIPSTAQPLLIQAMQQGDITWNVRSEDPWIHVSRLRGTTIGGRDTVVVSARLPDGETPGVRTGRLLFEAPPWPDAPVEVRWEIGEAPVAELRRRTSVRPLVLVAIGVVVVGTAVGLVAF